MSIKLKTTLNSISDFEKLIKEIYPISYKDETYFPYFRGHSLTSYELLPSISRKSNENIQTQEKELLIKLRKNKDNYHFHTEPLFTEKENDWNLLIQAQHIDFKTRLLDWTMKWEIALWFAVENEIHHDEDGAFYLFYVPNSIIIDNTERKGNFYKKDLNFLEKTFFINAPTFYTSKSTHNIAMTRRKRQWGLFTISPFDLVKQPLNEQVELKGIFHKITIPANSKIKIKEDLNNMGICKEFIKFES